MFKFKVCDVIPSLRALDTTSAEDLLMTWTIYRGQLAWLAMVMAR